MKRNYQILACIFFVAAVLLRISLWWSNPAGNFFDDHFEPIFFIMQYGTIPAKDACLQCYHPPVFYWISAMIGNLAFKMGADFLTITKILQFICCLYGIITIWIIYLIIKKIQLPDFAKLHSLWDRMLFAATYLYVCHKFERHDILFICSYLSLPVASRH